MPIREWVFYEFGLLTWRDLYMCVRRENGVSRVWLIKHNVCFFSTNTNKSKQALLFIKKVVPSKLPLLFVCAHGCLFALLYAHLCVYTRKQTSSCAGWWDIQAMVSDTGEFMHPYSEKRHFWQVWMSFDLWIILIAGLFWPSFVFIRLFFGTCKLNQPFFYLSGRHEWMYLSLIVQQIQKKLTQTL